MTMPEAMFRICGLTKHAVQSIAGLVCVTHALQLKNFALTTYSSSVHCDVLLLSVADHPEPAASSSSVFASTLVLDDQL
jgi:hypothetical protein